MIANIILMGIFGTIGVLILLWLFQDPNDPDGWA